MSHTREPVLRVLLAALEFENLERNAEMAKTLDALAPQCTHCGIDCIQCCRLCGITVCPADEELHVTTRCLLFNELPPVVRFSQQFHLRGLARILRLRAPETQPAARPLCASGNLFADRGLAEQLLDEVERIMVDEIPAFAEPGPNERLVPRDFAVRVVHEAATGMAFFAALMDAEKQRGTRTVAMGKDHMDLLQSTCCPAALAKTVPPTSTAAWRQICLSFNLQENENRPVCASGAHCIGCKILNCDRRPFGQPLRAMRSPIGELLSDADDRVGGLCLLCMSAEIAGNLRANLLWQDPEGMFHPRYMVRRGNFAIVAPVVSDLLVSSYRLGDRVIFDVDESALRVPNARLF